MSDEQIIEDAPPITSTDYWYKVVGFLQHNWAVVEPTQNNDGFVVFFFGDTNGIFDSLVFKTSEDAARDLARNGFMRYDTALRAHDYVPKPKSRFHVHPHPNGCIYSSGRYWKKD